MQVVLPTVAQHAAANRTSDATSNSTLKTNNDEGASTLRSEGGGRSELEMPIESANHLAIPEDPSNTSSKKIHESGQRGIQPGHTVLVDPSDEEAFLRFAEVSLSLSYL